MSTNNGKRFSFKTLIVALAIVIVGLISGQPAFVLTGVTDAVQAVQVLMSKEEG